MMLPSPDSTGAQNHDRKPNGIPLDSVRPENALMACLGHAAERGERGLCQYRGRRMRRNHAPMRPDDLIGVERLVAIAAEVRGAAMRAVPTPLTTGPPKARAPRESTR